MSAAIPSDVVGVDLCMIEATVVSGFEEVAAKEVEDKLGVKAQPLYDDFETFKGTQFSRRHRARVIYGGARGVLVGTRSVFRCVRLSIRGLLRWLVVNVVVKIDETWAFTVSK